MRHPPFINYPSFPKLIPNIPERIPTITQSKNLTKSYNPKVASAPNKIPIAYKDM